MHQPEHGGGRRASTRPAAPAVVPEDMRDDLVPLRLSPRRVPRGPIFRRSFQPVLGVRSDFRKAGIPDEEIRPLKMDPHAYGQVLDESYWIEAPLSNEWTAAYRVVAQRGQTVIAELRVLPRAVGAYWSGRWAGELRPHSATVPRGGLSASVVRSIRVGAHLQAGEDILAVMRTKGHLDEQSDEQIGRSVRRRMQDRSTLDLARLAKRYVDALQRGSRRPIHDIATEDRVEASTIRMAIYRARQRGLLTKPKQGSRGGTLTPAAAQLLKRTSRKGGRK
jgi:hypothetical protein